MDVRNCVTTDQYKRIQGARLKVQNKTLSVYKGVNTVGRNKTAIINIKNVNVSQHHALIIIVDDTQHFISDLNSSNGTYLHDTRLAPFKLYELTNEVEITFGDEAASYSKMSNLSTTVHLDTEPMELTQNVTQNFYAAPTQLMFDDLSLNQTRSSSVHHISIPNGDSPDIHEVATQVVEYPLQITDTNTEDNVTIETVCDDIHEAATQVFAFSPQASTSRASRDTTIQRRVEDIDEIATRVILFPLDKNKGEQTGLPEVDRNVCDSATPIAKPGKSNDEPFNPDDFFMNSQSRADSSVIEDSIIETTVMEEKVGNVETVENNVVANGDSNDSMDFLTIQEPHNVNAAQFNDIANITGDRKSTTSDSQDVGQSKTGPPRKLSFSEDISENQNKACNSDSDTDIENANEEKLLKSEIQTNKRASNSDSETDIEDEQPKTSKKRPKAISSDSETDIEDEVLHNLNLTQSEDIVKPKVLNKKSVFGSDSETEVDKKHNSAPEADEDADSNATEILNDTDYIPATQDAFADVFQYKNSVKVSTNSQNLSSEESFKLGLTELMIDGENNESVAEEVTKGESDGVAQVQSSDKTAGLYTASKERSNINAECGETDEGTNLQSTQKLESNNVDDSASSATKNMDIKDSKKMEDKAKLPIASTNIGTDADEDIYMMPTQKMNEVLVTNKINQLSSVPSTSKVVNTEKEAGEDFYMMSTQKIDEPEHEFKAPAKKFTFKKKTTNLEGSLTNILSSKGEEDPFLMATHKTNETEDDIYLQPTQKLENNTENLEKSQGNDDLYMQPTQDLNPSASEAKDQTEKDLFAASTQQINQINALYTVETQKFECHAHLSSPNDGEGYLYGLITPPADYETTHNCEEPITETLPDKGQVETLSSAKDLLVTQQYSPRRKRMKKSDIENLKRTIESKEKMDDAETLSQIEAFIRKPSEDAPQLEENAGTCKILVEAQINKSDETESEASIKTPSDVSLPKVKICLPSKFAVSVEPVVEDIDRSETLSQIKAFVRKPLNVKMPQSEENPSTSVGRNEIMRQNKIPSRTRQSTKLSEEDAYLAPTQEIKQDGDEMNESDSKVYKGGATKDMSNAELYMLETQQIDYRPDIFEPDDVPQNNKRCSSVALGHEETTAKCLEDVGVPKRKKVKKSDAQDLKKPIDFKEDDGDNDRPETLSQIDAYIKKPLAVVAPKFRKLTKIKEIHPTSSGDEGDQVKDAIKQEQHIDEFEKPEVFRASRSRQSAKLLGQEANKTSTKLQKSNELGVRDVGTDKNVNTSSADSDTVRSDVDQSFALLEAKSTKTRKSNRITSVGEIKVAAIKNRRSMTTTSIPDFSKIVIESKPTTRTARKVTVNNNIVTPAPPTDNSRRAIGESNTATRKSDSSDSDFLESEIPTKKPRLVRRGKKKAAEDIDKANTNNKEGSKEAPSKAPKPIAAGKGKRKTSVADDVDKVASEESNKEASSKTPRASVARKGKGNATVVDHIDKASSTREESNKEASSKMPSVTVTSKGKGKSDDIDKAFTTNEEGIKEEFSKTPRASMARRGKGKANAAGAIDKASASSEESNREVSSNTPRASARRGKEKATIVDYVDLASTTSEESNEVVSSKTPKASKGQSAVKVDMDKVSASRRSNRGKETVTPSTSRASSRLTTPKNSEDNRSESGSAYDLPVATPSRRGRSTVPDHTPLVSPERSKRKQRPKVVFTMMDNPQLESLIKQLGGSVVDSVDASTVLVTEHVKRSQKLLTAVGQGKPVCSPNWIHASKKANEFLDPWEFILTDKEAESKWDFSLKESISKAANEKLLVNYSFQLLVTNAMDVLKDAIESCGGKCVGRNPPKNAEGFYVVVASPQNKTKYSKIKKQNPEAIIVEPEAIFDGVLRQDLRLGRHLLM